MSSNYIPNSPPSSIPSIPSSPMRLLIPMPIPRTPGAPYFDERGVRAFLDCILQHGSNAGIANADELVSFLVYYSSDRVRQVIQYIPEIDPDESNRSWSAAREQMLLLYGLSDEERRASERYLIEFCREQSEKSPYRSKLEIQQYLHDFQFIAAPLVKQQEITIAQRDFYFVSGIPTSIKHWFIDRVPESQRTRSNPIPLADTLDILYGYFDPDTLCPDLWDDICGSSEPPTPTLSSSSCLSSAKSIPPSLPSLPTFSASTRLDIPPFLHQFQPNAVVDLLTPSPHRPAPTSSPAVCTAPLRVLDTPGSPLASTPWDLDYAYDERQLDSTAVRDLDNTDDRCEGSTAEVEFEVPPSDNWLDSEGECPVYFCGHNEITDRISEIRHILAQAASLGVSITELSSLCDALEVSRAFNSDQDMQFAIAKVSMRVQAHLKQSLATISNCADAELSQRDSINDDADTVRGSEVDSIFDRVPESDTDLETDARSSCSVLENIDSSFDTDVNPRESSNFEEPFAVLEPDIESQRVPRVGDVPLSVSEEAALTAFANAIAERIDIRLKHESRAKPSIHCLSYVNFFVPELFDIPERPQMRRELVEMPQYVSQRDDPPHYKPSSTASTPSSPCIQVQPKVEYIYFVVSWLIFCARLLYQGLSFAVSATRALFTILETFADPVPTDSFQTPPHVVQVIELDHNLKNMDSDSRYRNEQTLRQNMCKPFSFEPSTEHQSNHEPFERAEPQPFYPCASYVDYFVPQLFEANPESVDQSVGVAEVPEPDDDPPSYQQSMLDNKAKFASSNHRKKAEYLSFILVWFAVCLKLFSSIVLCTISYLVLLCFQSNDVLAFESIRKLDAPQPTNRCQATESEPGGRQSLRSIPIRATEDQS